MFTGWLTRLVAPYAFQLALAGAIVVAVVGFWFNVRHSGRLIERAESREKLLEEIRSAKAVENEARGLSPSDVKQRLRDRWSRG